MDATFGWSSRRAALTLVATLFMKSPPAPPCEIERQAALDATNLLDTLPEADFDDLVEVAAYLCGAPIAAVSLIDHDRQWFKSIRGLDVTETPRDVAFCAHAILEPEQMLEVSDAAADPRFVDNPLVTGEFGLRFYAGVPLVTDDGFALGALCVLDTRPRQLDDRQRKALRALSRQVTAQIKLRQRSTDLEMVNRELRVARDLAEEASAGRTRLLASVSHELRTPMNGVLGMSTLLLTTALDPEQRELTETIRTSSEQLLRLLNQLLDFARLEAEAQVELEQRPVDLLASIDEVIELVSPEAAAKSLDVHVLIAPEVPSLVLADAGRLRQILVNLVGNAIKFTTRGEVLIELGPGAQPGHWQVAVTDSGPGLPPERIAGLFRPFYRIAETAHQTPGTGLGLAICRRLVELMDGRVWAENVPDRGARFSFSLAAVAVATTTPAPLVGMRARVVSASPIARRALLSRLRRWGADATAVAPEAPLAGPVVEAPPAQALLVDPRPVDLLLLDGAVPACLTVRLLESTAGGAPASNEVVLPRPVRWRRLLRRLELHRSPGAAPLVDPQSHGFDASLARSLPLTILLVEDNLINQRVAAKMLERFGYQVRVVSDGQQAVAVLAAEEFDVVLMDIHMPVLDGLGATRQLRHNGSGAWVVAMTASAFESDRDACVEAGMDDYITKPLLVPELTQTLRRASAALQRRSS